MRIATRYRLLQTHLSAGIGERLRGRHPESQLAVELVLEYATVRLDHLRGCDVVRIAGDQRRGDSAHGSLGRHCAQHRGGVAVAAGSRSDVVADVPTLAEQVLGQPVPERDPAEVTVPAEPLPSRTGHPALQARRLLERVRMQGPHESREALSRTPRPAEGPDLVSDHGVVVGAAAPLDGELGHRGQERLADLGGRQLQVRHRDE